ncbi:ATP-binding protein [Streptomyces sp. JUS-F4]|uniref:ATP-binding protein n=1 Tax=Streptomyces TaxID=1883 RepID=UPI0004AA860A|nr:MULTISPECIES: ATP-binding protein [Streptomyces]WKN13163.1 ATP-binding protein [Streptomyces sp. JUS-F4]
MTTELPPEIAHFVDREDETAQVFAGLEEWTAPNRAFPVVVWGPAGLGRTELAHRIARTWYARTGGRVLTADLDRFRLRGRLDAGDVLGHLLNSLEVETLAARLDDRSRQFWRKTGDEPLILVLDNAKYDSEVAPLLPPSGTAVVILVSRGPLPDLADGTALEIALSSFPESVSLELLGLLVRDRRLAADPAAARELVRLCSGLPAALHAVGGWVRRNPLLPLSRLITELSTQFKEKGISEVESLWDETYAELRPEAALLYRLLAGVPDISLTREAAAALLGLGDEAGDDALQELNRAGFLDIRDLLHRENGRIRLPEWLGDHARRRARLDAADGELATAQLRFVRWVLYQSQLADRFAAGPRLTVADDVLEREGAPDALLENPEEATDPVVAEARKLRAARWLYEERHTLFACVRLAHARGWDEEAWQLSEPVWTFFLDHPHQTDVSEVFRTANESAVRAGSNIPAIVRTYSQLARSLWQSGRTDEAGDALRHAAAGARMLGDSVRDAKLRASVVEFRGTLSGVRGDWASAVQDFEESRDLHRAIPNPYGEMLLTYRLGEAHLKLGDPETAADLLSLAHTTALTQGRARMTGRTGLALGQALCQVGRTAEARGFVEASLDAARGRKSDLGAAGALDVLARIADDEGNTGEAEEHRNAAEELRRRHGLA